MNFDYSKKVRLK